MARTTPFGDRIAAVSVRERALAERALNECAIHERYMRQCSKRLPHAQSPMEHPIERPSSYERASIFGHYKPETIDLSED